jgi:hypothetical protein
MKSLETNTRNKKLSANRTPAPILEDKSEFPVFLTDLWGDILNSNVSVKDAKSALAEWKKKRKSAGSGRGHIGTGIIDKTETFLFL